MMHATRWPSPTALQLCARRAQPLVDAEATPSPTRPDPQAVMARTLRPLWRLCAWMSWFLLALALAGPTLTGEPKASLLAAIPGMILGMAWFIGRSEARRRIAMVIATSTTGFLALTTCGVVGSLSHFSPAIAYQGANLFLACSFLGSAFPVWRRVDREGKRAVAELALFEEL